jgi:hypothetical protein
LFLIGVVVLDGATGEVFERVGGVAMRTLGVLLLLFVNIGILRLDSEIPIFPPVPFDLPPTPTLPPVLGLGVLINLVVLMPPLFPQLSQCP